MRLLLLSFLLLSHALYEDQLGKFDWYRRGLGVPVYADLHPKKPRLLTLTDALLAHVHLRDGDVLWRRRMDAVTDLFVSHGDNALITIEGGTLFKAWSQGDGAMRWEREYGNLEAYTTVDGRWSTLTTAKEGRIETRGVGDGALLWSGTVQAGKGYHVFSSGTEGMRLLSVSSGQLLITSIEGDKGENITTVQIPITQAPDIQPTAACIFKGHIIVLYPGHRCRGTQAGDSVSCRETKTKRVLMDNVLLYVDDKTGRANLRTVDGMDGHTIEDYVIHSPVVKMGQGGAFAVASLRSSKYRIAVYDSHDGTFLHEEFYHQLPVSFHLDRLFLGSYTRKNATVGYRFLSIGRHGEVLLLQQGQMVWERNEASSAIVASMFVDPPTHGASHIQTDIASWIQAQILGLKVQFRFAKALEKKQLMELKDHLIGKHLAVRDASGYRKFILVLTRYHTVMALHNGDGRILWQTYLQSHQSFEGMTLWQYAHGEDRRMTVLLYKTGMHAEYAEIDAHTGEIIQSGKLESFSKIIKLPHPVKLGSADRYQFLLLSPTNPHGFLGRRLEHSDTPIHPRDVILWEADKENGIVRGWAAKGYHTQTIEFSEIWKLNVHGRLHCTTERGSNDPVHSYTKVLGDRSLLFKYLNPNTALIIAGDEGQDFDDAHLEAFVIDTVTGRILFRQLHESAKGPVHAVISQHWVAYHYWSISNQRFQMSTLEMYDASHRQLTVSDLLLRKIDEERLSSYRPIPVRVYNATFFVPLSVTHLTPTKTAKGITTQLLLMATATDQIYAMNRRFLDPRRPLRSTPAMQEERLMLYSEQLPIIQTHYASHNRHILGLKGMECSPAGLESGTHLFAYGIDIYYTRLQPERGFDTLDEDFNYGFLILTLAAMIVGSVVFRSMVKEAQLLKKWK